MKRLVKYLSYAVLVLISGLLLLSLFAQTSLFKNWLRGRVEALLAENVNGEVTLHSIDGNLFTRLSIDELAVTLDGRDVLNIKRVDVDYQLLHLLFKSLSIQRLVFVEPHLFLRQGKVEWNVERLFTLQSTAGDSTPLVDEKEAEFHWQIDMPNIEVNSGLIDIEAGGDSSMKLPHEIYDLKIAMGLGIAKGTSRLSLQHLSFKTRDPELSVATIESELTYDSKQVSLTAGRLRTEGTHITTSLDIQDLENPLISLLLSGRPVALAEIRRILPGIALYGVPQIDLAAEGRLDSLSLTSLLRFGPSVIAVNGTLQVHEPPYEYDLKGHISRLDLQELLGDAALASNLNVNFALRGTGVEFGNAHASLDLTLDSSRIFQKEIGPSELHASLSGDSLTFDFASSLFATSTDLSGWVRMGEDDLQYGMQGHIDGLDVSRIDTSIVVNSNLNLMFDILGQNRGSGGGSTTAEVRVLPSAINGIPLDSAYVHCNISGDSVRVDQLRVNSPLGELNASGTIAFAGDNNFQIKAIFADLEVLSNALAIDSLHGSGRLSAKLTGPADSLSMAADLLLQAVGNGDLIIEQLQARASGLITDHGNRFDVTLQVGETTFSEARLDSTVLQIQWADSTAAFDLEITQSAELSGRALGRFLVTSAGYQISIDKFDIHHHAQEWQKTTEPTTITVRGSQIECAGLGFTSNGQSVRLSADIDPQRENEVHLLLSHVDISRYTNLLASDIGLEGNLDFEVTLWGRMSDPRVHAQAKVNNGKYLDEPFQSLVGDFRYADEIFVWNGSLGKAKGDSLLESSGRLPLSLSFSPFSSEFDPDKQMEVKLSTRGINLAFLQAFTTGVTNFQGTLVADIVLRNTYNDLRGIGPVRLIDASFEVAELGTRYEKLNIVVDLEDRKLLIRDFRLRSAEGSLRIIEGALSLSRENEENFNARFKADVFPLMNNKMMQSQVHGDLTISGSVTAPQITGDLKLYRSTINYLEWFEDENIVHLTTRPFFVIEPDTGEVDSSGALRFQKATDVVEESFTENRFYKNLRGELRLAFPRNVWIRGPNTNIEVTGAISAVKEGENFTLFGSLSTLRGFYHVLGKRFQVDSGELTFVGDPEHNPNLAIEASYLFQDNSEGGKPVTKKLQVNIGGTLFYPDFRFQLDDREARHEDVLAILVFGQSFDNLPFNQKADVSGGGLDEQATGLLTSQAMSAIAGRIGREFNLDVIQIEGGEGISDAKVRVGKYVTPEVFVSVSQDFGADGKQKVQLEYEIPISLFINLLIQASLEENDTGLDLIWKLEW